MKRKWWRWLLVFIGVTIVLIYLSKSPAKGKISYQPNKFPTPSPMEFIRYDGDDFSFAYENKYELSENGSSWQLIGKSGVMSQIVISVNKVKSADIEDISGVLMRRVKKAEYTESTINWGETEGIMFEHIGSFELTAFFLKDGRAVTVAMTANSNDNSGLRDEFQKLVDSME